MYAVGILLKSGTALSEKVSEALTFSLAMP
jgi:hypothetical protein